MERASGEMAKPEKGEERGCPRSGRRSGQNGSLRRVCAGLCGLRNRCIAAYACRARGKV